MWRSPTGHVKVRKALAPVLVHLRIDVPRRRLLPPGNNDSAGADGPYGTIFSSLFGEPVPALVTTFEVAPFTRAVATWAGVDEVWPAR